MTTPLHHSQADAVRVAQLVDAASIAESHVASWQAGYRGLFPDALLDNLSVEDRQRFWEQLLAEERKPVFVAEQEGRVVGFVSCGPSRDEDADPAQVAEIYAIYLHPDAWGQGHGRRLSDAAVAYLAEKGSREITLWVLRNNQRARRFYEHIGFETDGGHKVETWRDDIELDEVRYRFRLASQV